MKTIAILVTFLFLAVCVQGAVWFNTATTNAAPTVLGPNVLSSVSNSAYSGWATNVINKPVVIAGTNGIQVITNGLGYTVSFTNATVGGGNAFVTQNPLTNDISGSVYGNISQSTNWIDLQAYKGFGQLAADSWHQNMNFFHGAIVAVGGLAGRPFWTASFNYSEYEDFADFPEALQGWLEEVPTYDLTTRLSKQRDFNPAGNVSIGLNTFGTPTATNTLQLWNLYYTKFLYEIWVKTHDKTLFGTYSERATNALNLMPTSGGLIYWASNYLVTFKDMDLLTNSRGYDLIGSVFLYDDYRMLAEIASGSGSNALATAYSNQMATISAALVTQLWDAPAGLYKGFSVSNRQHSLWGNAYAVVSGAAPTTQKTLICSNFLAQWGTTNYWLHGALRVLPAGETWDADGTGGGFQKTTYGPWVADLTFEVLWQAGRPDYAYELANDYMKEAVRRASGETLEAWNSETDALDPQFADYMIAASGRPLGWIQKHLPANTSGISYVPMPGSPEVISQPLNSTQDYLWGYKGPWPDPFAVGFLKWSINSNGLFSGTAAQAIHATNADLSSFVSGILSNA